MTQPTLEDILDAFSSRPESDTVEPDPESLYLDTIVSELEAVSAAYLDTGASDAVKLQAACFRIPGLLHLYKIS